ncbi:accessory gene regulator B family protein [Paenibacillus hexagrammi]|uniref:Accessory gene regulator B family protein n=1 Tax=Paenibacillus hexagrammi TaxID=2908839 RepID=A0ABY3SQS1_9BACL|nr:accessory gene regulator B family protein [Paenibacillus sp. YPD9-1]UJF36212.1 accessory gene regulator B family protein [Paenibacillus sp. YPD9-1]
MNYFIIISLVEILSIATGDFLRSFIPLIAFPLLRYFTGGLHFKNPMTCNVVTALFMLTSLYVPIDFLHVGLAFNAIALFIVLLRAPTNISRFKESQYPALKIIAAVVILSNFWLQSPLLATIYLLQAVTLLRTVQKAVVLCKL